MPAPRRRMVAYSLEHPIGLAYAEYPYNLGSSVRRPDFSFELTKPGMGDIPDLIVEIVSSDLVAALSKKIHLFFSYGTRLAWVILPDEWLVWVFRPAGHITELRENDWLEAPDLLPGFRLRVGDFFAGLKESGTTEPDSSLRPE